MLFLFPYAIKVIDVIYIVCIADLFYCINLLATAPNRRLTVADAVRDDDIGGAFHAVIKIMSNSHDLFFFVILVPMVADIVGNALHVVLIAAT